MANKVLVVAAHPDDEVLGCGATMAKHVANGDKVRVVIMAEGLTSRDNNRNVSAHKKELSELAKTAQKANAELGVKDVIFYNCPDNRMDSMNLLDVVKLVEKQVDEFKPNIVYTHHVGDVNVDHQVTHKAVLTACRTVPGQCVKKVMMFEVQSSTEWQFANCAPAFEPMVYNDVSKFYSKKEKALQAYACEMREWPHSRSIKALEHLAALRGSHVGVNYAESFMLGFEVLE